MRSWKPGHLAAAALLAVACKTVPVVTPTEPAPIVVPVTAELLAPESFGHITDRAARSKALFVEAGKVLTHARCLNCHPADDAPRQGDLMKLHDPPVARGAGGHGTFINACHSCHQNRNSPDAPVPGAPLWHLAPKSMAWQGVTLAKLCAQLKDPARNGTRNLEQIIQHSAKDPLVGWAWAPGPGRAPAPGTQERFGALLTEWAAAGADCPD
jgi:mono/diheme cytochrome c family protein